MNDYLATWVRISKLRLFIDSFMPMHPTYLFFFKFYFLFKLIALKLFVFYFTLTLYVMPSWIESSVWSQPLPGFFMKPFELFVQVLSSVMIVLFSRLISPVSFKFWNASKLRPSTNMRIGREVEIMKKLNHKNVVRYFDWFEDERYHCIIMELLEGTSFVNYIS